MCLCVFIFAACNGTIFYLYVLQAYQTHLTYNPARIGSHKDIFPTLYALSLSNTAHKSLSGRNILAKMAKNFTYSRDTSFALRDKKDFMELYNELFTYAIARRIQNANTTHDSP